MWHSTILTCYPESFPGALGISLARRFRGLIWDFSVVDMKEFACNNRCDDPPYGGGGGMILRPDVVERSLGSFDIASRPIILFTPSGRTLDVSLVRFFAENKKGCICICNRFEGYDERISQYFDLYEISLGDYVLSGGELASQVFIECCIRLIPGFMKKSMHKESFDNGDKIQYPHYTKPYNWRGMCVPDVLLSGHHENIYKWRCSRSLAKTDKKKSL